MKRGLQDYRDAGALNNSTSQSGEGKRSLSLATHQEVILHRTLIGGLHLIKLLSQSLVLEKSFTSCETQSDKRQYVFCFLHLNHLYFFISLVGVFLSSGFPALALYSGIFKPGPRVYVLVCE